MTATDVSAAGSAGSAATQQRPLGYAAVAAAASLWGTWSLFFRPAERMAAVSPAVQSIIVMLTGFLVMAPLAWRDRRGAPRAAIRLIAARNQQPGATNREQTSPEAALEPHPRLAGERFRRRRCCQQPDRCSRAPRVWLLMAAVGVVDAFNILFFFMAMQHTSLAVAVLTHYLALPLVAVTAPLVLRERTTPSAWISFAVALLGLTLLVEPWRASSHGALLGAALGSASALFFAGNVLLSKHASTLLLPREVYAWRMPSAILVQLFFVPSGGFALPATVYLLLGSAALVGGVTAGGLYYWGLARVDASRATVLSLLEPTVAVLIGIVVWREIPGPAAAIGALLIVGALYAATRR